MDWTIVTNNIDQLGYLAVVVAIVSFVVKSAKGFDTLFGLFDRVSNRKLSKINEYLIKDDSGLNSNELSGLLKNQRDMLYFKSVFGFEGDIEYRKAMLKLYNDLYPKLKLSTISYCHMYTTVREGEIVVEFSKANKIDVFFGYLMSGFFGLLFWAFLFLGAFADIKNYFLLACVELVLGFVSLAFFMQCTPYLTAKSIIKLVKEAKHNKKLQE